MSIYSKMKIMKKSKHVILKGKFSKMSSFKIIIIVIKITSNNKILFLTKLIK